MSLLQSALHFPDIHNLFSCFKS